MDTLSVTSYIIAGCSLLQVIIAVAEGKWGYALGFVAATLQIINLQLSR